MKRECGSCTMCCKTLGVPDMTPAPKRPHVWCGHCDIGKGCKVYADRPTTCREFSCVWLQDTMNLLPEDARPDKCGVVLTATSDQHGLVAQCDPHRPTAWRGSKVFPTLKACANAGYHASARAGDRYWVITAKGDYVADPLWVEHLPNGSTQLRIPHVDAVRMGMTPP